MSDEVIRRLRDETAVWAVVGLSHNRARAAYEVASYLIGQGKQIVPVHPAADTVHGQPGYASLRDIPHRVDVVDVFVRSELAGSVVDDAIAIGARAVWLQLGVIDEAAAERARAAGLDVVMDRCPILDFPRV